MSASAPTPKTYAELRHAVEAVVLRGRQEIDRAWLQTYHETGRLINEHILRFKERADYGAEVYQRLAEDTGISKRTLHECSQFHRYFPIVRTCAQLGWAQCRLLCQVADEKQRESLRVQTIKHGWTAVELATRVRALNAAADAADSEGDDASRNPAPEVKRLTPKRGTPGLHLVVDRGAGRLAVDLGFKLYRPLTTQDAKRLDAGDIVRIDAEGFLHWEKQATRADLFTYPATVRRVVDGDTLIVSLQVAPDLLLDEKLRLRGLDCPELVTSEGKAAKRFVDGLLPPGSAVVLSTTKPDKYDRYLADVFVENASGTDDAKTTGAPAGTGGVFLNNALLEHGHAVRKDAWEFGDWEPS